MSEYLRQKADQLCKRRMEEQELMLAKFIKDNPDCDISKLKLVSYWSLENPYKYVTEIMVK